jgi:hypothetical protein
MKITFSKIPVLTLLGLALFVSDRAQAQSTDGDTVNVGEVTITATGLTTSTRKTGYGVSQIKSKSIVSSGESGIIQAMTGKASNVQITRSTGDPGAGARPGPP